MMNQPPPLDRPKLQALEEMIASARNYVTPSDDLRPQTLETAREESRLQNAANRLLLTGLSCLLVWCILAVFFRKAGDYREHVTGPFPEQIERTAESYRVEKHYEPGWGMVDAFRDERGIHGASAAARSLSVADDSIDR